jgi:ferric-dicitrate binding protein FerR (iron transport regulator)
MNSNDYSNFEDFILEDTFREYVEGSNETSIQYWNAWISEHPDKKNEVAKARDVLITLIHPQAKEITIDKNTSLRELFTEIEKSNGKTSALKYMASAWTRIAAVMILSVGLTLAFQAIFDKKEVFEGPVTYNEIIVPIGEKSQVVLSDGTHVWINSGSRFKYPVGFGKDSRDVTLIGEAYFDVTKGKSAFIVNTHDATIRVLGTAFNVKSYPEDNKTQTTVVRGLVRVESKSPGIDPVLIKPDQMAVLRDKEETGINPISSVQKMNVVDRVNSTAITSWKDQMLVFSDETFEDIAVKMERWFNVKITIRDEKTKTERYTGKFVHNETIYEVLKAIELTTPIEYTIKNDVIEIKRK